MTGGIEIAPSRLSLQKRIRDLIVQAAEADDVKFASEAISIALEPLAESSAEKVMQKLFPRTFSRNAPKYSAISSLRAQTSKIAQLP